MRRQILAVVSGLALSFLASAAAGYFLYRLSDRWPNQLPALARYIFGPIMAVVVGTCVGILAQSRPATLAALSLAPSVIYLIPFHGQNTSHVPIMAFVAILDLLAGMAAANVTFRFRASGKVASAK